MSTNSRNLFLDKCAKIKLLPTWTPEKGDLLNNTSASGLLFLGLAPGMYGDYKYLELKKKNDPSPWRKTYGSGFLGELAAGLPGLAVGTALGGPVGGAIGAVSGALPAGILGVKGGAEGSGLQHIFPTLGGAAGGAYLGGLAAAYLNKDQDTRKRDEYIGMGLGALGGGLGGYYLSKLISE